MVIVAVPKKDHEPTKLVKLDSFEMDSLTWMVQDFPVQVRFSCPINQLVFHGMRTSVIFVGVRPDGEGKPFISQTPNDNIEAQLLGWLSSLSLMVSSQSLGFKTKPPKVIVIGTHRRLARLFDGQLEVISMQAISCFDEGKSLPLML